MRSLNTSFVFGWRSHCQSNRPSQFWLMLKSDLKSWRDYRYSRLPSTRTRMNKKKDISPGNSGLKRLSTSLGWRLIRKFLQTIGLIAWKNLFKEIIVLAMIAWLVTTSQALKPLIITSNIMGIVKWFLLMMRTEGDPHNLSNRMTQNPSWYIRMCPFLFSNHYWNSLTF